MGLTHLPLLWGLLLTWGTHSGFGIEHWYNLRCGHVLAGWCAHVWLFPLTPLFQDTAFLLILSPVPLGPRDALR